MFISMRRKGWILGLILVSTALAPAAPDEPLSLEALAKARLEVARKNFEEMEYRIMHPPASKDASGADRITTMEQLATWSRRWMEAERDMSNKKADRVTAIEAHGERMKKWEDISVKSLEGESSEASQLIVNTLKFHRLEAEYWLAKVKAE